MGGAQILWCRCRCRTGRNFGDVITPYLYHRVTGKHSTPVRNGGTPGDPETLRMARLWGDHALEWGWDEQHGGFYDRGSAFHPAYALEKVWWTQAEGLNALLLAHEHFGGGSSRYFDAFLKQWRFIAEHQVDHRYGGWHAAVAADGAAEPGRDKATIWKAAYHNGRALMEVSHRLRRLAGAGRH